MSHTFGSHTGCGDTSPRQAFALAFSFSVCASFASLEEKSGLTTLRRDDLFIDQAFQAVLS
jgi:hypothetical protein